MKIFTVKSADNTIRLLNASSIILGIIALIWLAFNYVLYNKLRAVMSESTELGRLETFGVFIWLSYLFLFIFHILATGILIVQSRYFRRIRILHALTLMAGVVSFICVFGDWAVLGDIGKEYKMGWDVSGEWKMLFIFLGIHAVFVLMVTVLSAEMLYNKENRARIKEREKKDETVFTFAQCVGITCGLVGIAYSIMLLMLSRMLDIPMSPKATVYHMVSTTIMILLPYGIMLFYWLTLKLKERMRDWYDEKQWRDVARAGFSTLLVSIPIMGLFFITVTLKQENYAETLLWFPFTLFLFLFLFSFLTLVNFRKA